MGPRDKYSLNLNDQQLFCTIVLRCDFLRDVFISVYKTSVEYLRNINKWSDKNTPMKNKATIIPQWTGIS